jgi:hypothetical protein
MDAAEKREVLIKLLEDALGLADEMEDGTTGYLIDRAPGDARAEPVIMPQLFGAAARKSAYEGDADVARWHWTVRTAAFDSQPTSRAWATV